MSRFKQAMYRFFAGRYGVDSLYRFSFVVWLLLAVVNMFVGSVVLYVIELLVMAWMFFRCLSRNVVKRSAENQKYLAIVGKIKGFFRLRKNKWHDRKTHAYRKCPSCHATLRFPKVKGEHDATCPRCKKPFHFSI
ncbi:MAG: hypothetical protein IJY12_02075 [Clostridia bacterium]|nr:hypothetical protein [Clostridia bacterium]